MTSAVDSVAGAPMRRFTPVGRHEGESSRVSASIGGPARRIAHPMCSGEYEPQNEQAVRLVIKSS
jgi:hypothetical protein